jgi:hypothetical protein
MRDIVDSLSGLSEDDRTKLLDALHEYLEGRRRDNWNRSVDQLNKALKALRDETDRRLSQVMREFWQIACDLLLCDVWNDEYSSMWFDALMEAQKQAQEDDSN